MKSIIVDLLGENRAVLPRDIPDDCIVFGKYPGWTWSSYLLAQMKAEWLLKEIQATIENQEISACTICIPATALAFAIVLVLMDGLCLRTANVRLVVEDGLDLVDLSGFITEREKETI